MRRNQCSVTCVGDLKFLRIAHSALYSTIMGSDRSLQPRIVPKRLDVSFLPEKCSDHAEGLNTVTWLLL
jgi:hypothetical protein